MKLREYIEKASLDGEGLGLTNPVLKRIAYRARCSEHMVYAIARGVRFAGIDLAEKISRATERHVTPLELMNDNPRKRGPAPANRTD
jgi:hypothetical protein